METVQAGRIDGAAEPLGAPADPGDAGVPAGAPPLHGDIVEFLVDLLLADDEEPDR